MPDAIRAVMAARGLCYRGADNLIQKVCKSEIDQPGPYCRRLVARGPALANITKDWDGTRFG